MAAAAKVPPKAYKMFKALKWQKLEKINTQSL
jgi:hypothetical protein